MFCILFILFLVTTTNAENFGRDGDNTWADTPAGRFECAQNNGLQTLKLGNEILFQQKDNEIVIETDELQYGIDDKSGSGRSECPQLIKNRDGYVIYSNYLINPNNTPGAIIDGIEEYSVINFNVDPPTHKSLAEVQIILKKNNPRFLWDKKGFTMQYVGYPYGVHYYDSENPKTLKPKYHTIRFDFATQKISRIK